MAYLRRQVGVWEIASIPRKASSAYRTNAVGLQSPMTLEVNTVRGRRALIPYEAANRVLISSRAVLRIVRKVNGTAPATAMPHPQPTANKSSTPSTVTR
jgi:hypothetical protein